MKPLGRTFLHCLQKKGSEQKTLWAALCLDWKTIIGSDSRMCFPQDLRKENTICTLVVGASRGQGFLLAQKSEILRRAVNVYAGRCVVNKLVVKEIDRLISPEVPAPRQQKTEQRALKEQESIWIQTEIKKNTTGQSKLDQALTSFGQALVTR